MTAPEAPAPATVAVELGARRYDVLIGPGLLRTIGEQMAARFPGARAVVVTDQNVVGLHERVVADALGAQYVGGISLVPGEATKCFADLEYVVEGLLEFGIERGDVVVALGGGVVGDLAGFAASVLRRGVRLVQVPTSLLAQVDSSVGGKTAINSRQGKNLIGAFHQPSLVLADTDVLSTLPIRELRAGYAEVVKYGLLGDAPFFAWLEANWRSIFGNDTAALVQAVETSVAAKAAIVARDETETGDRMLLNLGHTFGHALEAWAGYGQRLLHGEAVAIGMAQAFRFSDQLGLAPPGTAGRVEAHLAAVGLPTRIGHIQGGGRPGVDALMTLMGQDKKVRRGRLTFILARGIGAAFVTRDIGEADVRAFLDRELELP